MSLRPKSRVPSPRQPQPPEFRRIAAAGTRGWGAVQVPIDAGWLAESLPNCSIGAAERIHLQRVRRSRVRVRVNCPLRHTPEKRTACFGPSPPGSSSQSSPFRPTNTQHISFFNLSLPPTRIFVPTPSCTRLPISPSLPSQACNPYSSLKNWTVLSFALSFWFYLAYL
ncbi:hypothetical protein CSPX01_05774 [Colletotrichum filicis]|nr:hypothetical protein CSPX01_05774 [Colletotrichum filicis]